MRREDLGDLTHLLTIVEEGNFTKAAARLGVSQSALSHAIRRLEERLGVRLLTRTTRSVAPTEAGERLLAAVRPSFEQIGNSLADLTSARDRPAGTIRITTPEHAARTLLWPAVDRISARYPLIKFELNVEAGFTDIVAERFDAGVRLGEQLAADMIAVRIGPQMRMAAVASPSYFAQRSKPQAPHDLAQHACINLRLTSAGSLYAWEFRKKGRDLKVRVDGPLIFNRAPLILDAAAAGHGIAFIMEDQVASFLAEGSLDVTEADWDEMMGVNLRGAFFMSQVVARAIASAGRGGRIVNISSQGGFVGLPDAAVYCASKGGLNMMTKTLALEWAKDAITVNAVAPTFIYTPGTAPILDEPKMRAAVLGKIPLGQFALTNDVAGAIIYLASDAGRMVTGTVLVVDGGWTSQ
jgi:DNA-binding transcriptional LysR family regulator